MIKIEMPGQQLDGEVFTYRDKGELCEMHDEFDAVEDYLASAQFGLSDDLSDLYLKLHKKRKSLKRDFWARVNSVLSITDNRQIKLEGVNLIKDGQIEYRFMVAKETLS